MSRTLGGVPTRDGTGGRGYGTKTRDSRTNIVGYKVWTSKLRNGNNYLRIGRLNEYSRFRVSIGSAPKHYKKLGPLGKALSPVHVHIEWRKVGIDLNWFGWGRYKRW